MTKKKDGVTWPAQQDSCEFGVSSATNGGIELLVLDMGITQCNR